MLHLPVTAVPEEQSTLLSAGLDEVSVLCIYNITGAFQQDEESIPLQIMLRLMDEVFELRLK